MFQIFSENKGSVTVLLTLLLVPFMIFSGIAADYAKIQGARTIVEGAQDLTANAALADFDLDLEQKYGLFAMAQSDLSTVLEPYFLNTIDSRRLLSEDGDEYTKTLINSLFSGEAESYDNLIQLVNEKVDASGLDGSQLSNPDVLTHQIVEFMKYRGPVALGVGFLEKLKVLSEVPKQQEAIEKKVEYEKKLDDLQQACADAYNAIVKYELSMKNEKNENVVKDSDERIKEQKEILDKQKDPAIWLLIMSCTDAGDRELKSFDELVEKAKEVNEIVYNSAMYNSEQMLANAKADLLSYVEGTETEGRGSTWKETSALLIQDIQTIANINLEEVDAEAIQTFMNIMTEYWMLNNDSGKITTIAAQYYYARDSYQKKLEQAAAAPTEEENTEEDSESSFEENTSVDLQAEKEKEDWEKIDKWYEETFKKEVNDFIYAITQFREDASKKIADLVNPSWDAIYTQYARVGDTSGFLGTAMKCLDTLSEKISAAEAAKTNWKASIDALSDSDIKQNMNSDYQTEAETLSVDDIHTLEELFGKNVVFFVKVMEETKKITFYDYSPSDVDSVKTDKLKEKYKFYNQDSGTVNIEDQKVAQEERYTTTDFEIEGKWEDHKDDKFYKFLKKLMASQKKKESADTNAKQAMDKLVEQANNVDLSVNDVSGAVSGDGLPSAGIGGATSKSVGKLDNSNEKNLASSGNAIMGNVSILSMLGNVEQTLKTLRDDLYVMVYASEMFSCYTTNNCGKETQKLEEDLLGNKIDKESHKNYRGELEYLAWGDKNIQQSVASNMAMIFAVRAVLNTVYAFTDAELCNFAFEVATLLVGWTGFGVPIVQTAIIIAAALAESALDLYHLRKGEDVPLLKSADNWTMKPSAATGAAIAAAAETTGEVAKTFVGNIFDTINEKSEEKLDELNAKLNGYYAQMEKSINETAVNSILTPVQNLITENLALAEDGFDIDAAMDQLFAQIRSDCNDGSVVSQVKLQMLSTCEGTIRSEAKNIYDTFSAKLKLGDGEQETKETASDIGAQLVENLKTMTQDLTSTLTSAATMLTNEKIAESKGKVQAWCKDNSAEAQQKIAEEIDRFSSSVSAGSSGSNDAGTMTSAKGLTMNYKEYTQVFLIIALMRGQDQVASRVGDLIQINSGIKLSDKYTILKLKTDNQVKTLFLSQDWSDFFGMNLTENYFDVDAELIRGY